MSLEIGPEMTELETELDWPFEINSEGELICFTHSDPIVYTGLNAMHWRYLLTKASEELVKCSHGHMN